ncbi:bifunctional (p)ppGpp synthetase/guanosine-3',5'-bis(diphosphate) 3'-pyrophosphohydrolase [bacterium]|nr:bifunctional (p)ppGpp synthetase/guanosine-3',5'-bis(diphosphate) 3'-pyrophosphohydrolase [bacterium]
MVWKDVRSKIKKTFGEQEVAKLEKAYQFTEKCHFGQKRLSGDPYVTHSIETAAILFELHSDSDAIAAGLLHDCIEDTDATYEEIEKVFGKEVADLVDGVTKIGTRVFRDSEEQKAENLRKIMLAMVRDIRVLVIKLADRLHNMRTLEYLPDDKRMRLARETIEIYAPLAHRLGMAKIKNELEDLGFKHLHFSEYTELILQVKSFEKQREADIASAQEQIVKLLSDIKIKASVSGRMKHLYSLWNKMRFQNKNLDQIFDLMALRIIVPAIKDCYAALGIVHAHWKPMPGRFKDFIAMPRSNMYQSLHTTVIGPSGEPLEIQIRTIEMHKTAEEGIAAHWSYKEGVSAGEAYTAKLSWFGQFLDWQNDLRDSREFMEALKIDLFEDEVYVFTPKGEVKSLRRNANPIDYAYLIHSKLGDTLVGAKVNGRLVPLRYELKNGDIVEVITRADGKPSRDWIKVVKTTKAKNRIRHYFRQIEKDDKVKHGKALLTVELERCGTTLNEMMKKERLLEVAQGMNLKSVEELLLQIGDANIGSRTIAGRLGLDLPSTQAPATAQPAASKADKAEASGVRVSGLAGMVIRYAQCCHPIPGDAITGYITQGRGVSIHRQDCSNVKTFLNEPDRYVQVSWDDMKDAVHDMQIFLRAAGRERLQTDLLRVFDDIRVHVKESTTRITQQNHFEAIFTIQIKGKDHLREIITALQKVKSVISVSRR